MFLLRVSSCLSVVFISTLLISSIKGQNSGDFWDIHCNAYKCECEVYQHRCEQTPTCVNDWDACLSDRDFCPFSENQCQNGKNANRTIIGVYNSMTSSIPRFSSGSLSIISMLLCQWWRPFQLCFPRRQRLLCVRAIRSLQLLSAGRLFAVHRPFLWNMGGLQFGMRPFSSIRLKLSMSVTVYVWRWFWEMPSSVDGRSVQ